MAALPRRRMLARHLRGAADLDRRHADLAKHADALDRSEAEGASLLKDAKAALQRLENAFGLGGK